MKRPNRRQIDQKVVADDWGEHHYHENGFRRQCYQNEEPCSSCGSFDCDSWFAEDCASDPLASLANAFEEPIYLDELEPWNLLR